MRHFFTGALCFPFNAIVASEREGCWLKGVCNSGGRTDADTWALDSLVERYGLALPSQEEVRCMARAREIWVLCANTETQPIVARYSLTDAEAVYPRLHQLAIDQWGQLESNAHFEMTHKWSSVNQFSDVDIAPTLRNCDFDNGIDWSKLRSTLFRSVGLQPEGSGNANFDEFHLHCRSDVQDLSAGLGSFADSPVGAWAVSDATSDCFMGMISLWVHNFLCAHALLERGHAETELEVEYGNLMDRTWISLEGLLFHLQDGGDPATSALEAITITTWPITELLAELALHLRSGVSVFMPSLCDRRGDADNSESLISALSVRFGLPQHRRQTVNQELDWKLLAVTPKRPWDKSEDCPFRHTSVLLASALESIEVASDFASARRSLVEAEHWLRSWQVDADITHGIFGLNVGPKVPRTRFFHDLFSSNWPVFSFLTRLKDEFRRGPLLRCGSVRASPVSFPRDACGIQDGGAEQFGIDVCRRGLCWHRQASVSDARRMSVFFVGGEENTAAWAAFSLRARQIGRSLRVLRKMNVRVWQNSCQSFCLFLQGKIAVRNSPNVEELQHSVDNHNGVSPDVVAHVKFLCHCALVLLPAAKHILDVVDNSKWVNTVEKISAEIDTNDSSVDGVIVESESGAAMLSSLPCFARKATPVFSIPHTTAIALDALSPRAEESVQRPVRLLALHTSHTDPVYIRIKEFLHQQHPEIVFKHWKPSNLFNGPTGKTAGRMISPPHLRRVQAQLTNIDMTVIKQSGCLSEPDFCRRFKPGQRLLHAWAAGVPTVIVLGASATFGTYLYTSTFERYPSEALVQTDGCMGSSWKADADGEEHAEVFCDGQSDDLLGAIDRVVRDSELRSRMRSAGLDIAAKWNPKRGADAFAAAFEEIHNNS